MLTLSKTIASGNKRQTLAYVSKIAVPLKTPKALSGISGLNPFAKKEIAVVLDEMPMLYQQLV